MSGKKQDPTGLVIGGEPRIDFLPLEIKQRKANRRSRRSLVLLVAVVIVICIGGYVASAGLAAQSQAQLDEARAQTQVLLKQQGQYVIAQSTASEIEAANGAKLVATSTEVLWKDYLAELKAALPSGAKIVQFNVDSLNALELEPLITIPLEQPRVGTIAFTVTASSLAKLDQLAVSIENITGFSDATIVTASTDADESADYTANVTFHFNSSAYERRLFPDAEVSADDAAVTDDAATEEG